MPALTLRDTGTRITDLPTCVRLLKECDVVYERWGTERLPASLSSRNLSDAEKQAVLDAFKADIDRLKRERGYKTADVVTLYPDTPNLDVLLAKFDKRHLHTDDEVRFVVQGRGVFTLFPQSGPHAGKTIDAELHPGDFITVPANYRHLFTLCDDKQITAIRIFLDPAGWVAHYV